MDAVALGDDADHHVPLLDLAPPAGHQLALLDRHLRRRALGDGDAQHPLLELGGDLLGVERRPEVEAAAEGAVAALHAQEVAVLAERRPAAGELQPPVVDRELDVLALDPRQLGVEQVGALGLEHVDGGAPGARRPPLRVVVLGGQERLLEQAVDPLLNAGQLLEVDLLQGHGSVRGSILSSCRRPRTRRRSPRPKSAGRSGRPALRPLPAPPARPPRRRRPAAGGRPPRPSCATPR